ncbi:MAG TPA: hypothetical protein VF666_14935 [Pyrinomonadaceae bacterium]|jgi:ElaB/YqjD/DUF883 family membrane-anchored ribosome-binding protein
MAEERNLGLARAPEPQITEEDATKAELQRRMEEARESITQTVSEIKDTVANQYQQVKQQLDWREQYRRRPVEFSAGALGVGLILGYSVGGVLKGGRDDYDDNDDYNTDADDDASVSASRLAAAPRSYAAQPITGSVSAASPYGRTSMPSEDVGPQTRYASAAGSGTEHEAASRPSYSSGYDASSNASQGMAYDDDSESQASKPGLLQRVKESGVIDKFKETKAYDRLQEEISTLGDRFVEELSSTAKNVVLPALLGKLKDMIGIDLSMQREVAQRAKVEHEASQASADVASVSEQRENTSTQGAS